MPQLDIERKNDGVTLTEGLRAGLFQVYYNLFNFPFFGLAHHTFASIFISMTV